MSVLRPRNRLVNFRLSEDEFEKLKASCDAFGARSISDFARGSVLSRLEGVQQDRTEPGRVVELDDKVSELETRVDQLIRLIEATSQPAASEEPQSITIQAGRSAPGA